MYNQILFEENKQSKVKNLKITLDNNVNLIDDKRLEHVISNVDIFEQEKKKTETYRISGELDIFATNVLVDKESFDSLKIVELKENIPLLEEKNGWYYYYNDETKTFLNPQPNQFTVNNFDLLFLQPFSYNEVDINFNQISINNGLGIRLHGETIVNNKNMTYFVTDITHNLNEDDEIILNINGVDIRCFVYGVGFEDGSYKNNIFLINKLFGVITQTAYFKKVVNGTPVEYKSLWLKKIDVKLDIFDKNIGVNVFNDKNYSFVLNNEINPSTFKIQSFNSFFTLLLKKTDDYWGNLLCGLETFVTDVNYDSENFYDGSSHLKVQPNITSQTDLFFGGIVEIGEETTIISEPFYVFNSKQRLTNDLNESYLYKPMQQIELSQESFKNGHFYLNVDLKYFIGRQDPCGVYNIGRNALIKGKCKKDISSVKNIKYVC